MESTSIDGFDLAGLRQRNKPQRVDPAGASELVGRLNEEEKTRGKARKTFGRTENGIVFVVPESHDMVSQLLSPSQPKNIGDVVILAILAFHIAIFYYIPVAYRSWVLGILFATWRSSYDIGIGYLLDVQSKYRRLVIWAEKLRLFVNPSSGQNPHPHLYNFIKRELEIKIVKDYKLEDAPIEYNTWLVFRRVVDLVLMSDFVSYALLAISLGLQERPLEESAWMTSLRWIGGISMILFNLWVKLDAHRVVKDFAWYWGDFFYLVDEKPVFDGVFQMAPHPMYSIGYIGYYGIAAIAKSYPLLFISITAHLMQFAFLFAVEMPHMDKTYPEEPEAPEYRERQLPGDINPTKSIATNGITIPTSNDRPSTVHNLAGIGSTDLCRVADTIGILIPIYCAAAVLLMPSDPWTQLLFVLHAAIWRVWYIAGLGIILHCESVKKLWTRHFVRYGESSEEAWRKWKEAYYVSERMAQSTFVAAAVKLYDIPADWTVDYILLKHVIAVILVGLQFTITASVYDTLGEFGVFYGDFFFPRRAKLNYNKGPYRYLNNPEQLAGMAGLWGTVLLTGSRLIFTLTLFSHALAFGFYYAVERPHQRRLYRGEVRKDSGVARTIRPFLPRSMQHWDLDAAMDRIVDRIELFLDNVAPKIMDQVSNSIKKSTTFFHRLPLRAGDAQIGDINTSRYTLEIIHDKPSSGPLVIAYGSPIKVRWTAPSDHSKKDWIGLYSVTHNTHRQSTNVSSAGRWIATNAGVYDSTTADQGCLSSDVTVSSTSPSTTAINSNKASSREKPTARDLVTGEMEFSGDKLFWTTGTYEFRYHHNGKHSVLAISQPFEIHISHFDDTDIDLGRINPNPDLTNSDEEENTFSLSAAAEMALLPLIQNCFDRDPAVAPSSVTAQFGSLVERNGKYSRRAVYAIWWMFGIELDAEVVKMDGNVRNLAWRIMSAKRVLAPYSMSASNGRSTPVASK